MLSVAGGRRLGRRVASRARPACQQARVFDATISVVDGPGKVPGAWCEDEAERWELAWDA